MAKSRTESSRSLSTKSSSSHRNSRRPESMTRAIKSPRKFDYKRMREFSDNDRYRPFKKRRKIYNYSENTSKTDCLNSNKCRKNSFPSSPSSGFLRNCKDLLKVRLSRSKLKTWCLLPFFSKTVIGCFVRVGCGTFKEQKIYRVAEIIDVVEPENKQGNKALHLRHGVEERVFNFEFVSNSDFTDLEFEKWKRLTKKNLLLPTMAHIKRKMNHLKDLDCQYKQNKIENLMGSPNIHVKNLKSVTNYIQRFCSKTGYDKVKNGHKDTNGRTINKTDFSTESSCVSNAQISLNRLGILHKESTTHNNLQTINKLCIEKNYNNVDLYTEMDTVLEREHEKKIGEDFWNLSLSPVANTTLDTDLEAGTKNMESTEALCETGNQETDMFKHMIYLSKLILTKI